KKENRFKDRIILHGPASCCSMMTDCADFCVTKPATKEEQKRHWTFKRRSFAHRCGIAVSVTTGDLRWVSEGDPAGSKGDLTITRRDGLLEGMKFFERMGADGAHLCKKDPEMMCPHRKKRNQSLTQAQRQWNTEFSRHRSMVENVFSRVKQFNSMRKWRHKREMHPALAHCVFGVVQIKNRFRPVRNVDRSSIDNTTSWAQAEANGVPTIPGNQVAARRNGAKRKAAAVANEDTDSDSDASPAPAPAAFNVNIADGLALEMRNREHMREVLREHKDGERRDRLMRRKMRAQERHDRTNPDNEQ
ncbi:MAG: transposase family protein, partial [Myxococcota bacterium]